MKLGKYLFIPWVALAIYTVLSVYQGSAGMVSYRALLGEREKIQENLNTLQFINQKLEGSRNALLYDAETIKVKARELGYGAKNERFVRIVGLPGGRPGNMRPGTIRTAIRPSGVPNKAHRIITFCIGMLFFGLFLAGDFCFGDRDRRINQNNVKFS